MYYGEITATEISGGLTSTCSTGVELAKPELRARLGRVRGARSSDSSGIKGMQPRRLRGRGRISGDGEAGFGATAVAIAGLDAELDVCAVCVILELFFSIQTNLSNISN